MGKNMDYFTFVVISYNHQEYIIEHLESIKYQVQTYASERKIKLVIADDGSRDKTLELAQFWVELNQNLFAEVVIQSDGINRGTCLNYTKTWPEIDSKFFKITAGDDVYSSEDIFEFVEELENLDLLSGMPLLLVDNKIKKSSNMIFHIFSSFFIYKGDFLKRMKRLSSTNTPSLFFSKDILALPGLADFINQYRVVEDFPMQIKIGESIRPLRFVQSSRVMVYYRRTQGSTYLIRNDDFSLDKISQFEYLISSDGNYFSKVFLKNRIYCFNIENKYLRIVLNLNCILYFINVVLNLPNTLSAMYEAQFPVTAYQKHYDMIRQRTYFVRSAYDLQDR